MGKARKHALGSGTESVKFYVFLRLPHLASGFGVSEHSQGFYLGDTLQTGLCY